MFCWLAQANASLICLGQLDPVQPLVNFILVSGSSIFCFGWRGHLYSSLERSLIVPCCLAFSLPFNHQPKSNYSWLFSPVSVCDILTIPSLETNRWLGWDSTELCYLPYAAVLDSLLVSLVGDDAYSLRQVRYSKHATRKGRKSCHSQLSDMRRTPIQQLIGLFARMLSLHCYR